MMKWTSTRYLIPMIWIGFGELLGAMVGIGTELGVLLGLLVFVVVLMVTMVGFAFLTRYYH